MQAHVAKVSNHRCVLGQPLADIINLGVGQVGFIHNLLTDGVDFAALSQVVQHLLVHVDRRVYKIDFSNIKSFFVASSFSLQFALTPAKSGLFLAAFTVLVGFLDDDNHPGRLKTPTGRVREAGLPSRLRTRIEGRRHARQENHGPPSAQVQTTLQQAQLGRGCCKDQHHQANAAKHRTDRELVDGFHSDFFTSANGTTTAL